MTVENAEEFPLCQALQASLAICTALGEKFGVRIESRLPPEDVRLLAVERMVRQIMINLVGNAIKFTPAGGNVQVSGPALRRWRLCRHGAGFRHRHERRGNRQGADALRPDREQDDRHP